MTRTPSGGRVDRIVASLLFVAATTLYVLSSPDGVYWGDSAQFALRVHELPSGIGARDYPLHGAACWAAGLVIRDAGTATALISWLFGAVTVSLVYWVARAFGCGRPSAVGAACMTALGPTLWGFSLIAEVYALHTALLLAVLLATVAMQPPRRERWVGFGLGLSLLHHRLLLLAWPAIVAWLLATAPRDARPAALRRLTGALVVGALPFLLLGASEISRGEFDGASDWLRHVFLGGSAHAERFLSPGGHGPLGGAIRAVAWTGLNVGFVGGAAALFGLARGKATVPKAGALLLGLLAPLYALAMWTGGSGDHVAFLVGAYPLLGVACALGLQALSRDRAASTIAWPAAAVAGSLGTALLLGTTGLGPRLRPAYTGIEAQRVFLPLRRHDENPENWCRAVLARVPRQARLHAEWGCAKALRYVQAVGGIGTDVEIMTSLGARPPDVRVGEFVALTPIWSRPRTRLVGLEPGLVLRGDGLFEMTSSGGD